MKVVDQLIDFLVPRYCKTCGRRLSVGESHLCVTCMIGLPLIGYDMESLSPAEKILLSERSVVRAASMMEYEKESEYRRIIYHMKYYDRPQVGCFLARMGARRLMAKGFFQGVDFIVPVPLSKSKMRSRGYNQCSYIARGISEITGLPVNEHALARRRGNRKQAGLGVSQRWSNAEGLYHVPDPGLFSGKHILLVDDVMTTGATLCSVIESLQHAVPDVRVTVFTLAIVRD